MKRHLSLAPATFSAFDPVPVKGDDPVTFYKVEQQHRRGAGANGTAVSFKEIGSPRCRAQRSANFSPRPLLRKLSTSSMDPSAHTSARKLSISAPGAP